MLWWTCKRDREREMSRHDWSLNLKVVLEKDENHYDGVTAAFLQVVTSVTICSVLTE